MLLLREDPTSGLKEYHSSLISTSWRKNIFLRMGTSFINRRVKVAVCSSFYHLRDSCHAVGWLDALSMLCVLVFNAYFELKQKIWNFEPNVYSVTKVSSLANQSNKVVRNLLPKVLQVRNPVSKNEKRNRGRHLRIDLRISQACTHTLIHRTCTPKYM